MKKLLLTAFEPFGGEIINPSLEVARAIKKEPFEKVSIEVLELPVKRFQAPEKAINHIFNNQPDVMIMLGEAGHRSHITPERVAINIDDFPIPDNVGDQPKGEPIMKDGPVGYFSKLPTDEIIKQVNSAGIPAEVSNSAGTYLCNRLFYNIMHVITVQKLPIKAGFIHLPYLHEQVLNKTTNFPSMSRKTLIEAVRIAIKASI